jgi:hypothetical protein
MPASTPHALTEWSGLAEVLAGTRSLIALDNVDSLRPDEVRQLIDAIPDAQFLLTSRGATRSPSCSAPRHAGFSRVAGRSSGAPCSRLATPSVSSPPIAMIPSTTHVVLIIAKVGEVKRFPTAKHSASGCSDPDRVQLGRQSPPQAQRRGGKIARVAVARQVLTLCCYRLRDWRHPLLGASTPRHQRRAGGRRMTNASPEQACAHQGAVADGLGLRGGSRRRIRRGRWVVHLGGGGRGFRGRPSCRRPIGGYGLHLAAANGRRERAAAPATVRVYLSTARALAAASAATTPSMACGCRRHQLGRRNRLPTPIRPTCCTCRTGAVVGNWGYALLRVLGDVIHPSGRGAAAAANAGSPSETISFDHSCGFWDARIR